MHVRFDVCSLPFRRCRWSVLVLPSETAHDLRLTDYYGILPNLGLITLFVRRGGNSPSRIALNDPCFLQSAILLFGILSRRILAASRSRSPKKVAQDDAEQSAASLEAHPEPNFVNQTILELRAAVAGLQDTVNAMGARKFSILSAEAAPKSGANVTSPIVPESAPSTSGPV